MSVSTPIADWLRTHKFLGGMTYAGHPLACASSVASIRAMIEAGIVERTAQSGSTVRGMLDDLADKHPSTAV